MGLPKYYLSVGDSRLYEYPLRRLGPLYDRQIIVENKGLIEAGDEQGRLVVRDIIANMGPLGGIYSGLKSSDALLNMVVGADMPFVSAALAQAMGERALMQDLDILVPDIDGLLEPLFSVYSSRVAVVAGRLLTSGICGVRALFQNESLRVGFVDRTYCEHYDECLLSFFNVNTPDDLVLAQQIMQARDKSAQEERVCG